MIPRKIDLPVKRKSVFLFGPRQVGKTTLVKHLLADVDHLEINLLKGDILIKYKSNPSILRAEVEFFIRNRDKAYVFIDEIQKCPELLNEVHYLIEKFKGKVSFILTGSSARKLKKVSVNMLAGRAWQFFLFPFTHVELDEKFTLNDALLRGTLPPVIDEPHEDMVRTLRSYVQTYLKEEILDEAIVRNIGAFSRFLDMAADQSGKIVNFSTISREAGVSSKTVKGYYQILEDTLIAIRLEPYMKSARKRLVMHPKYYLFDIGVINAINGRTSVASVRGSSAYGMLFEHFVILETFRLFHYAEKPFRLFHWRSSHGAEVDLIVEGPHSLWAIEIKSSPVVRSGDLRGLRSFMKDHPSAEPLCVSTCDVPYMAGEIPVIPWKSLFGKEYLDIVS
ncbi:MAG: ATP-binding protein [Deltaproteobacteria bacterium]|nr:ATP-binding protein [Deltaproteobacteria bacterium]RLB81766.1 MAG: ATP-binding protein [Deltaproteobacteria bacterium]